MACTGRDGLRADPERTRSVAEMSAGLTFPEKVTVISVGDEVTVSVAPAGERAPPATGTSEVVTTRKRAADRLAAGAAVLEGTDVAWAVSGQDQAAVDVDLRVAQEVGRDRRRLPRVVDRRRNEVRLEIGVDVEVRRTIRAGPGVDREDEGRVADEVAQVRSRRPRPSFPARPG